MRKGSLVSALIWLNLSVSDALAEHIIHKERLGHKDDEAMKKEASQKFSELMKSL